MRALFGVTVNSLSSVQAAIESKLGEKSAILYKNKDKGYSTKKILLFPNVNSLRANLEKLKDWNGIGVVFDSPINLYNINKLRWLDVKRNSDVLSYKFDLIKPDYQKLFDAYESKEKSSVKVKKKDVLKALIVNRSDTPFLEKVSNFLYFCTSHVNREQCKKLILDYFEGSLTVEKLKNELRLHLKKDQVEYYLKDFLEFLKSERGLAIKAAWRSLSDKIDEAKAAKRNNVDIKDLRYIKRIAPVEKSVEVVKKK
jgi:hypothetical protein